MEDPIDEQNELERMSLLEHLDEFRKRLMVIAIFFLVATIVAYYFVPGFVDKVLLLGDGYNFVYISPSELFMQYIRIALIAGLAFTIPVILYEIWMFLFPGLTKSESIIVGITFFVGIIFFILGACFAYFIIIPFLLQYFLAFDTVEGVVPMITFINYIGFIITNIITFGIIFELPTLTMALTQLGLLQWEWLVKGRRYVIIIVLVIAAIITPPDIVSQVITAIPMLILYEVSILISRFLSLFKRRKKVDDDL